VVVEGSIFNLKVPLWLFVVPYVPVISEVSAEKCPEYIMGTYTKPQSQRGKRQKCERKKKRTSTESPSSSVLIISYSSISKLLPLISALNFV
jgi:hypothetical protein